MGLLFPTITWLSLENVTLSHWPRTVQWRFSRAHFPLFFLFTSRTLTFFYTTKRLYPSWYRARWTVLLDTCPSLCSLNLVVASFNGVLRSLRTCRTSTLLFLSSSGRRRPVCGLFSTVPLPRKRTITSETVPLGIPTGYLLQFMYTLTYFHHHFMSSDNCFEYVNSVHYYYRQNVNFRFNFINKSDALYCG